MPEGMGTYGTKRGRPPKKSKKVVNMVKRVAGFMPRPKGNESIRTRAEAQFSQIQKNKQTLSENEKAKQVDQEKMARLKALRLAKEVTSK